MHHLDGHLAVVLEVVGQVHGSHAAPAQLPLDPVRIGKCGGEALEDSRA